jgi:hypothetical protein
MEASCGLRVLLKILQAQGSVVSKPIGGLKDQFCVVFDEGKRDRSPVLRCWCQLGIDGSGFATVFRGGLTSDRHQNPLSELAKRFIRNNHRERTLLTHEEIW